MNWFVGAFLTGFVALYIGSWIHDIVSKKNDMRYRQLAYDIANEAINITDGVMRGLSRDMPEFKTKEKQALRILKIAEAARLNAEKKLCPSKQAYKVANETKQMAEELAGIQKPNEA